MLLVRHIFVFIICLLSIPSAVIGGEFVVSGNHDTDTIYFASTAKLEFIEGTSHSISGGFTFDHSQPKSGATGILKVDLTTLKTGIETRDEHMRDNHLHTEKYPHAYYELTEVTGLPPVVETDSVYVLSGKGYFYIHGVKREQSCQLKLNVTDEKRIRIEASFSIELDDYKIDRPKALFLKLAKRINIRVVFDGKPSMKIETITLPEYPLITD